MKRITCMLFVLAFGSVTASADELTDPVEILKKVDAATKAVNAVKFKVSADGSSARAGKVEGTIAMAGFADGSPKKFYFDLTVSLPDSDEPRRVTGGTDYDSYFVVDHKGKTAYEDIDPTVMGPGTGLFRRAGMIEFVHEEPFSDEINGKSRELKGSETIDGEDCYVVHVVYAGNFERSATWSFSKKDFLPRRRIDSFTGRDGQPATFRKTITDLVIDPKLEDSMFKLDLPAGFKKTDEFAPDFLASGE